MLFTKRIPSLPLIAKHISKERLLRILRIRWVLLQLQKGHAPLSWAGLAARAGYSAQAHLIRESQFFCRKDAHPVLKKDVAFFQYIPPGNDYPNFMMTYHNFSFSALRSFSAGLFCQAGVFCIVLGGLAASLSGQQLADLDWLAGHWVGTFGGQYFESHYTTPKGGMILSVSKQIQEGRVTLFELERFVEKDGKIVLTPFPFGKASSDDFLLADFVSGQRKARFLSPEHDFPTEIIYELVAPDELNITTAGESNGKRVEILARLQKQR